MNRRNLRIITLAALLAVCLVIPSAFAYVAGEYEATANGHNGPVKVKTTFDESTILSVEVIAHEETAGIGDAAISAIPELIVSTQGTAVDAVAGATVTSQAILAAVADSIAQAGGTQAAQDAVETQEEETQALPAEELTTDVLVIGGGGAGLSAAIEAKRAGADVIVLERLAFLGGDTIRAGGGIEAAGTRFQEMHGITGDTPKAQEDFINSRGITYRNPELLRIMTEQAADAVEFLVEMGSDMSGTPVAGHGSPVGRAHRAPTGSAGQNIVNPMIAEAEKLGIIIYLGTPGVELLATDGQVHGAKAVRLSDGQPLNIQAKAVVIATGNFVSNNEMLAQYDQRLRGIDTNSSAGSLGDGIIMATAVGADLENMSIFRVTTGFPRGDNFIALSQDGIRFMNEKHTDDTIFRKGDDLHILVNQNREEKHYYVVFDQAEYDAFAKTYESYEAQGALMKADTLEALAEQLNLTADTLSESILAWNSGVTKGADPLGRDVSAAKAIEKAPYYAIKVKPKAHTSAGGIRIDASAAVLTSQNQVIPGLYAAGEVTGGVHDGVSAVEGAIVYGRIAGKSAAAYVAEAK